MDAAQKRQLLKVSAADLASLSVDGRGMVKALMQLRQGMYDLFGAYPQENILPYWYAFSRTSAKSNAVPASGTAQASTKVSADSAFVCTQICATSTGDFTILPRTDASDRQLVNEAVHSSTIAGTAERPHYLPKPLLLPANTTISYDITDLSGAVNEIYFALVGYKVYQRG